MACIKSNTELKIYEQYQKYGVETYYKKFSSKYTNPHQDKIIQIYIKYIKPLINSTNSILDLACGDGLISRLVNTYNNNYLIEGCDPYFTNKYCNFKYSFEDIVKGKLQKYYDIIICCYAYHLIDNNLEYDFLTNISMITKKFIIISQSKKIQINHPLWKIVKELREDKVTLIILENT